jgi:hypothetical protein
VFQALSLPNPLRASLPDTNGTQMLLTDTKIYIDLSANIRKLFLAAKPLVQPNCVGTPATPAICAF